MTSPQLSLFGDNGDGEAEPSLFALEDVGLDQRRQDVLTIHRGTAIYTQRGEVEALLDRLNWPLQGQRLLDPGAGNGGFVVAALNRVPLRKDDVRSAAYHVCGYEFYPGAVAEARRNVADHLVERDWSRRAAEDAAQEIIKERDFLLQAVPVGTFDVIAANPPYWRLTNLPRDYRLEYETQVPTHAQADLLYAYLDRSAEVVKEGGRIGLITSDRWLLNKHAGKLRERIGQRFTVTDILRLRHESAFYRAKIRAKGTLARVDPVSVVLTPDDSGRKLTRDLFPITLMPEVDGRPLRELIDIRLAPYLGPRGIFLVTDVSDFPPGSYVPAVVPRDISPTGELKPATHWAILTGPEEPSAAVMEHLQKQHHLMPADSRRSEIWFPPEKFAGKLPLDYDAVMIPRVSKKMRAVLLPAGRMPVNHDLVLATGLPPEVVMRIIDDPVVQEQANGLALGIDNGYHSYTHTLLSQLVVPKELLRSIEQDTGIALMDSAGGVEL